MSRLLSGAVALVTAQVGLLFDDFGPVRANSDGTFDYPAFFYQPTEKYSKN